jgi:hypothetical protein
VTVKKEDSISRKDFLKNSSIGMAGLVLGSYSGFGSISTEIQKIPFDICIYGTTSAGVIAAYAAKKCGKSVLLVGPAKRIGGMTTGGLGQTDSGKKGAITGLARNFYRDVGKKYGVAESWNFEPHVALGVYQDYMKEEGVDVNLEKQLVQVIKDRASIHSIVLRDVSQRNSDQLSLIKAKEFLDCTYEGDLMGMAGIEYTTGRESNQKYNETLDGVQLAQARYHQFPDGVDPYKTPDNPASSLLWGISGNSLLNDGSADNRIQAYCFRVCLTNQANNKIPITRPDGYDSQTYELLARLFKAQPNKRGLNDYFIWSRMPNHKTDVNNRGAFSTDMIGMNQTWPTATYEQRQKMLREARRYTKGLLYFYVHDKRVPGILQKKVRQWGYPKDEYQEFDHFTPQLYIREGRRMIGEYVMTEHNCRGQRTVGDGIGLGSYQMDSHHCERIATDKMVKNEGDVEVGVPHPYPISYRSLTPKRDQCTNLIVPVCLSASHIAYGSIRMEPVFMILGQSAAMASVMAMEGKTAVQKINVKKLQRWLKADPYLKKGNR